MRVRNNNRVPRACEPNLLPITASARPTRPFTTTATVKLSSAPRTTSQESNSLEITIPRIGRNNYQIKISNLRPRFWFHYFHTNYSKNYGLHLTGTSLVNSVYISHFPYIFSTVCSIIQPPFSVGWLPMSIYHYSYYTYIVSWFISLFQTRVLKYICIDPHLLNFLPFFSFLVSRIISLGNSPAAQIGTQTAQHFRTIAWNRLLVTVLFSPTVSEITALRKLLHILSVAQSRSGSGQHFEKSLYTEPLPVDRLDKWKVIQIPLRLGQFPPRQVHKLNKMDLS